MTKIWGNIFNNKKIPEIDILKEFCNLVDEYIKLDKDEKISISQAYNLLDKTSKKNGKDYVNLKGKKLKELQTKKKQHSSLYPNSNLLEEINSQLGINLWENKKELDHKDPLCIFLNDYTISKRYTVYIPREEAKLPDKKGESSGCFTLYKNKNREFNQLVIDFYENRYRDCLYQIISSLKSGANILKEHTNLQVYKQTPYKFVINQGKKNPDTNEGILEDIFRSQYNKIIITNYVLGGVGALAAISLTASFLILGTSTLGIALETLSIAIGLLTIVTFASENIYRSVTKHLVKDDKKWTEEINKSKRGTLLLKTDFVYNI